MKFYKFVYSFGPFEDDYIFLFSTESELNEIIREKAYTKCLSLIDKNIDDEHEFIRFNNESNNEVLSELEYNLKDYMNKREFFVKHKNDIISGKLVEEVFTFIGIFETYIEVF